MPKKVGVRICYFFIFFIAFFVSKAQQIRAFDPGLFSIGFDVKPFTHVGQMGTYTFSFGNLGSCVMPVSRGALVMTIRMSKDTVLPATGNPLTDLSGPFVPYFNWSFNAGTNSFIGTQISNFPDVGFEGGGIFSGLGSFNVSIIYAIATPMSMNFNQGGNGVYISLTLPAYVTGTNNPNPPTNPPNCIGTQVGGNADNDAIKGFNYFGGNLPLSGLNLQVKKMEVNRSRINWSTFTELNTLNFQVERSIELIGNWNVVNTQSAAGNSSNPHNYYFDDNVPIGTKKVYYRIKTIDIDGSLSLSEIKSLRFDQTLNRFRIVGFPNPTKSKYTINLESLKDESLAIEIIDLIGKRISLEIIQAKSGFNTHDLNLSQLSSGTYIIKVSGGGVMDSSRVMKVE